MIKNYFFLSRVASELNRIIKNSIIFECFTSQKDTLFITLFDQKKYTLSFCVNHSLPFIQLQELFNRKKHNSLEIFPNIINLKFTDVFIAKNDRVLLLQIENEISLFFAIRGKFTNIYLLQGTDFISFKRVSTDELEIIKNQLLSLEFVRPLTIPDFSVEDKQLNIDELKKKYPFLSKEITNNLELKSQPSLEALVEEIKKIYYEDFYLIIDFVNKSTEINYYLINKSYGKKIEKYSSALDITSKYIQMLKYFNDFSKISDSIQKYIEKELKNLSNKKKNILNRLELGSKENEFKKIAELLLINKSKLKSGMDEIIVNDIFHNNDSIIIQLNKTLTPQQNIEYYFKKSKDEKIFFDRGYKILSDIDERLRTLENTKIELTKCSSMDEVLFLMKKIGLKMKKDQNKPDEPKIRFRHYIIEGHYNVFLGKDSKSNDLLTTKFAKQNDYWFHARSVSGSHVILRIENKTEIISKRILEKVASIAAFHSKAKSSSLVPVSYTQKKYVIKKKGMEIGQVALLKENTLLVKPEIPKDTVIVGQEKIETF